MSDDREFSNIYTIPPNYTDSGKLMGGMLETRNTVEAGILLVLVGYPEVKWLPVDLTTKIVIMTVTLIPLGVFALMGIGGDSLLQYVTHMIRFWHRRRCQNRIIWVTYWSRESPPIPMSAKTPSGISVTVIMTILVVRSTGSHLTSG